VARFCLPPALLPVPLLARRHGLRPRGGPCCPPPPPWLSLKLCRAIKFTQPKHRTLLGAPTWPNFGGCSIKTGLMMTTAMTPKATGAKVSCHNGIAYSSGSAPLDKGYSIERLPRQSWGESSRQGGRRHGSDRLLSPGMRRSRERSLDHFIHRLMRKDSLAPRKQSAQRCTLPSTGLEDNPGGGAVGSRMVRQPCAQPSLGEVASFLLPSKPDILLANEWFYPMLREVVHVIVGGPPRLPTTPAPPVDWWEDDFPLRPLSP
jgi:hypothetical protein